MGGQPRKMISIHDPRLPQIWDNACIDAKITLDFETCLNWAGSGRYRCIVDDGCALVDVQHMQAIVQRYANNCEARSIFVYRHGDFSEEINAQIAKGILSVGKRQAQTIMASLSGAHKVGNERFTPRESVEAEAARRQGEMRINMSGQVVTVSAALC